MSINLYNCNCLDKFSEIQDKSVDLIVTDPPYLTTSRGSAGNSGGMMQKELNLKGQVFQYNSIDCSKYAPEFYRVLKLNTHCYVMTNHINLIHMLNVFTSVGFTFTKSLIWDKGNKIMGKYYMSQFEYILFFRKGGDRAINDCGISDILSIPNIKLKDENGNNYHDTEKPVPLMEILVKNSSNKGELVLDPFMGIGSTGIACKNLGRNFIGCEIDKKYFDIAEKRINNSTTTKKLF